MAIVCKPARRVAGIVLIAWLAGCAVAPTPDAPEPTRPPLAGWSEFKFPGKRSTRYTATRRDGVEVIRAEADGSASMLRRPVQLAPADIGAIEFSWRVDALIPGADLGDRDASDSPVRIVLAFDGDLSRLSARNRMMFDLAQALTGEAPPYATLMYVWDNQAPAESIIHSPRTDRIRKIVVESGPAHTGAWHAYRRDIVADYRRAFGEAPGPLVGLGLMTDADNTGLQARADYGAVRLMPRSERPD